RNAIEVVRSHLPKICRSDLRIRSSKTVPVERIEHLEVQAKTIALSKSNRLAHPQVFRGQARIAKICKIARCIAELSIRRIREACGVEISSADLPVVVFADIATRNHIRIHII